MPNDTDHQTFETPHCGMAEHPQLFAPPDQSTSNGGQLDLEADLIAGQPDAEPLPSFILDMFEVAGIPRSMSAGDSLRWTNACGTSTIFESAHAQINGDASWFELVLVHQTGRSQRLRCNRYGDVLALEDSAGVEPNELLQNAYAGVLLDFSSATKQLMVRH